jgi:ParB family chromosome partitioning protein
MNTDMKKRGLGRGLDALFKDVKREEASFEPKIKRASEMVPTESLTATASVTAANAAPTQAPSSSTTFTATRKIAVEKLTPGKFQPRRIFSDEALDQLAESISVHGILQPILVRPLSSGMFEIIAGERRWRAAQKAQQHEVPIVVQQMTDKEAMEIALIENLQREDLSPLEESEGYQRLMDEFGHSHEQLSQQLGKSRSHVTNMLRLLKLPQGVRNLLQSGALSAGHARALVGTKNPEQLAGVIVKRGLSVRQTEQLVKKAEEGKVDTTPRTPGFKQKDVDILALEQKMTTLLGLRVSIEGAPAGKISVEYKTLEQLDDVLARLSTVPRKAM